MEVWLHLLKLEGALYFVKVKRVLLAFQIFRITVCSRCTRHSCPDFRSLRRKMPNSPAEARTPVPGKASSHFTQLTER